MITALLLAPQRFTLPAKRLPERKNCRSILMQLGTIYLPILQQTTDNVSVKTDQATILLQKEDHAFIDPVRIFLVWDVYKGESGIKSSVINSLAKTL